MALIKCTECGKEISSEATACPGCGAPVKAVQVSPKSESILLKSKLFFSIVMFGIVIVVFGVMVLIADRSGTASGGKDSCSANYTKCKDNKDFIDHSGAYYTAMSACEISVNNHVKYGTPEWDSHAFGSVQVGDDVPRLGIVKLFDDGVKIQNMFGAQVNSKVSCEYDLNSKKVLTIAINNEDPITISTRLSVANEQQTPAASQQPQGEAANPEISALIKKWQDAAAQCQTGDDKDVNTKIACEQRDHILPNELKSKGWCYNDDPAVKDWEKCHG